MLIAMIGVLVAALLAVSRFGGSEEADEPVTGFPGQFNIHSDTTDVTAHQP